jgi:hypothetical protein
MTMAYARGITCWCSTHAALAATIEAVAPPDQVLAPGGHRGGRRVQRHLQRLDGGPNFPPDVPGASFKVTVFHPPVGSPRN